MGSMGARASGPGRADGDADTVRTVADAYVLAWPLLMTYALLHEQVVSGSRPLGALTHTPAPSARDGAPPWADPGVLLCEAWLDLRSEPVVLSHPAVPEGRYVGVELTDLFAHEVGRLGVLRTGQHAATWAVVGPRWSGTLPPGLTGALHARSDIVRLLGRVAVPGPGGATGAEALRGALRLAPLHELTGGAPPRPVPPPAWLPWDEDRALGTGFLDYLAFATGLGGDPGRADRELLARAARLGAPRGSAVPGSRAEHALVARGVALGAAVLQDALARQPSPHTTACVADDTDGTACARLGRAVSADRELHAPSPQETLTVRWRDLDGEPLHGDRPYSLTFRRPPPARLGWSLAVHAEPSGAPLGPGPHGWVGGGSDPPDPTGARPSGATTFALQPHPPADAGGRARWVRTSPGAFRVTARLYAPEPSAVHGEWVPPVLRALP